MNRVFHTYLCTLFLATILQAGTSCYEILSENYTRESRAFQIYDEAPLNTISATRAMLTAMMAIHCPLVIFTQGGIRDKICTEIIPGRESTRVCYMETNVGYYFVMADMTGFKNIVWNRWD